MCQRVDYGREPIQGDDNQHKTRNVEAKDPGESELQTNKDCDLVHKVLTSQLGTMNLDLSIVT